MKELAGLMAIGIFDFLKSCRSLLGVVFVFLICIPVLATCLGIYILSYLVEGICFIFHTMQDNKAYSDTDEKEE